MIPVATTLAEILATGGFQHRWLADVIYDGERVMQDVELESCTLKSDGNAKIRTQGTADLVYSDDLGQTIVPERITSWLTPYATYLNISYVVSIGGYEERVLRGQFKIVGVTDPQESRILFQNRVITLGSRIRLRLADAFAVTERERFPAPSSPSQLASVWTEIGLLTGFPLNRTVADAAITRDVTYQESRLDALFDLASILDGIPYMDPNGRLAIMPRVWPAASEALTIGVQGRIVSTSISDLTDEGIYNQVVVRSHADDQTLILASSELVSGPLRYEGPFGRVPYFASSDFITTTAQAQTYANDLLPTVSRIPAAGFTIEALPDPRREVGDVVPFDRENERITGRIVELTLSGAGPMVLKVAVDRD